MKLSVDFNKPIGKIKPIHGVGQPPFSGINFGMLRYLTEAGIPYSRLHDVGGLYGMNRYVDIPNIFRDESLDPELAASYDFGFTDVLITALCRAGVEPIFRLGVTIENDHDISTLRINPPKSPEKWARICEHIVRHYNEGWANGYHLGLRYFEIWNEPDDTPDINLNPMWKGTAEEFFELYITTAKHLGALFPNIKIGGYGSCGFYKVANAVCDTDHEIDTGYFLDFFERFLDVVKETGAPFDFFSFHSYDSSVENNVTYAKYVRSRLDAKGFSKTEAILNEWNSEFEARGTLRHASLTAATLLALQDSPLDSANFYDARCGIGIYGSLFNPISRLPYPTYYAFTAFNRLYRLGSGVYLECSAKDIYAVAARNGKKLAIVIANPTGREEELSIEGLGKPDQYIITDRRGVDRATDYLPKLPPESILTICYILH